MIKKLDFFILVAFLVILTSCSNKVNLEIELYPAYEKDLNKKKWGFIDNDGSYIIEPIYDSVGNFKNGLAIVEKDGYFNIINKEGEELENINYEAIKYLEGGFYLLESTDTGNILKNELGEKIELNQGYSYIGKYSNGLFLVASESAGNKFGYIDSKGRELIKLEYDWASNFVNGKALVKKNGIFKIIDSRGGIFKKLNFKYINKSSTDGVYIFKDNFNREGLINEEGNLLLEAIYKKIELVGEEFIVVLNEENKKLIIDYTGKIIEDGNIEDYILLGNGFLAVGFYEEDSSRIKYKILNREKRYLNKGELFFLNKNHKGYINGYLSLWDKGISFLIDENGERLEKIIINRPNSYLAYKNGVYFTSSYNKERYYNSKAEIIWESDNNYYINEDIWIVEKNSKDEFIEIMYPQVIGLKDKELEGQINQKLYKFFHENLFADKKDKIISYNLNHKDNLLFIKKLVYSYNGSYSEEIATMDLEIGNFIKLGDFLKREDIDKLNNLLRQKYKNILDWDRLEVLNTESLFIRENDSYYFNLKYREVGSGKYYFERLELSNQELENIEKYR